MKKYVSGDLHENPTPSSTTDSLIKEDDAKFDVVLSSCLCLLAELADTLRASFALRKSGTHTRRGANTYLKVQPGMPKTNSLSGVYLLRVHNFLTARPTPNRKLQELENTCVSA